tara:strand:- start:53074 stop:53370 length:297 start_codon:yes stop_codon:yes gene_type:complete
MIVTFTTKAYTDITMFGDVALSLLNMMGHSGTVPSAILAADVPEALTQLKSALDAKEEQVSPQNTNDDEPKVSMHNRALPLLALLTAAAKEKTDVMWK